MPPCHGGCCEFESRLPLQFRRYSQVVRQRSAKPSFPGSSPGGASTSQQTTLHLKAPLLAGLLRTLRCCSFSAKSHACSAYSLASVLATAPLRYQLFAVCAPTARLIKNKQFKFGRCTQRQVAAPDITIHFGGLRYFCARKSISIS